MKRHTIHVDFMCNSVDEIKDHLPEGFKYTVIDESGPGGGFPFIQVFANTKAELKKWFCEDFCGSNIETEGEEFEEFYYYFTMEAE